MNDNIPVSKLPSRTKLRWWSGDPGSRRLKEMRVDILVNDISRTFQAPSAMKPYYLEEDTYLPYPWGFGGFSGLGF